MCFQQTLKTYTVSLQRQQKETGCTASTAEWHHQGYVVKNPWSDDQGQALNIRSHPRSGQRLLSDALRSSGPVEPWLMWRWPNVTSYAVVVTKILYASPAWSGFITATDWQRVDAYFRRSKRCGFCPPDLPSFEEMLEDAKAKKLKPRYLV